MTLLNIGDKAPGFTLPCDGGGEVSLSAFKGKKVVLYFYPKDDTPGCTKESCAFNDDLKAFEKVGAQVIGLSKCSVKKHDKFKEKYGLKFPLASDEEGDVCERYGTWVEKNMYGRKYMGIERTTFLINEKGKIAQIWCKVKVAGHVEAVMEALQEMETKAA
ncbi:MAG: thioredoxin-dependent thiol peroxidase [Alphaproteobacteria bacterium]|nr:thioredoxin-dependent thiol peroxidase [Alphaproteobacteria bacterium]